MSDNKDPDSGQDFDSTVEEALRELDVTVGPDKQGDLNKEPPETVTARAPTTLSNVETSSTGGGPGRTRIRLDSPYTVWYGTNRRPIAAADQLVGFSSDQDTKTHYGRCEVFIPRSHKIGSIGSNLLVRILKLADDRLSLRMIEPFLEPDFWAAIAEEMKPFEQSRKQAVVFIHGYNVSFKEAALRAAQIGLDAAVETPMAFFSWPSRGTLKGYFSDEDAISASEKAIEDFLVKFANQSGASIVHVIAHSMGNRGLLRAVSSIQQRAERRIFGQIILAAADVATDLFLQFHAAYLKSAIRTTLYVSESDLAVEASRFIHGRPRVGLVPPLFFASGIDTINVTGVNLSLLGHGYVANTRPVLADIQRLLREDTHPDDRGLRQRKNEAGHMYWEIGA